MSKHRHARRKNESVTNWLATVKPVKTTKKKKNNKKNQK